MQHRSRLRVLVCIPADLPKLIYAIRPALALSIQVDPADWFARGSMSLTNLSGSRPNKLKKDLAVEEVKSLLAARPDPKRWGDSPRVKENRGRAFRRSRD
jgi:hypothetical protein